MKIAKVLGTDDLFAYLDKYSLELSPHYDGILSRYWLALPVPSNRSGHVT